MCNIKDLPTYEMVDPQKRRISFFLEVSRVVSYHALYIKKIAQLIHKTQLSFLVKYTV